MSADDVRDGLARALYEDDFRAALHGKPFDEVPAEDQEWWLTTADAALAYLAALPPTAPEVVTTAAELDALPVLSVIVDASGHSWYRPDEEWVCLDGDRFSSGLIWEEAEHPIMLHRPSPYRPTTTEDQP